MTEHITSQRCHSKINNSTGHDKNNIQYLKHVRPLGRVYLTQLYTLALNINIIPQMSKLANIIPILKPNKNNITRSLYRPISHYNSQNTREKTTLPYITNNILHIITQHL